MHGDTDTGLKRAHSLIMKVEGDTRDDLIRELEHVIFRIRTEDITRGVSGGYSTSNIYSYCQNPDMTHDIYFEQLNAWLAREREADQLTPSSTGNGDRNG